MCTAVVNISYFIDSVMEVEVFIEGNRVRPSKLFHGGYLVMVNWPSTFEWTGSRSGLVEGLERLFFLYLRDSVNPTLPLEG